MRISEKNIVDIQIGDAVTSAIGNPGTIAAIYPEGKADLFGRKGDGSARMLILWSTRNWSIVDQEIADAISVGRIDSSHFVIDKAKDTPIIIIDGSGSITTPGQWQAIQEDIASHWAGHVPVHIVSSITGDPLAGWSGIVSDLENGIPDEVDLSMECLGASISQLASTDRTAIVYTDGCVVDPESLQKALQGRPHELIVMRGPDTPDPLPSSESYGLRRRDVHFSLTA